MIIEHSLDLFAKYPASTTAAIRLAGATRGEVATLCDEAPDRLGPRAPEELISESIEYWGRVFSQMGTKPAYVSSLASLRLYQREHGRLFSIDSVVDFYNDYSLRMGVPMAAYDVRQISGRLVLGRADRKLPFIPLGKPKEKQHVRTGEVAYFDDEKVICRYWNWRDSEATKIVADSADILFIFDLHDAPERSAEATYHQLCDDFSKVFHGMSLTTAYAGGPDSNIMTLTN